MRIGTIRPVYVESFPKTLEDGVLYISRPFGTACHRCCCGCGTKIVTPLRPTEYRLIDSGGRVSLYPSVGNWNHSCQSHYVIRNGQVVPAGSMNDSEIAEGRVHDEREKRAYYVPTNRSSLEDFCAWLQSLFR
jgi:hypothetical protein